jgi:hypothetical protein
MGNWIHILCGFRDADRILVVFAQFGRVLWIP